MKKILSIILIAILALSLAACNKAGTNGNAPANTTAESSEAPAPGDSAKPGTADPTPEVPEPIETSESNLITREEAIDTALAKAGLTQDAVYDLECELERGPEGIFWEVDFDTYEYEYSYVINAITGGIVHEEQERD